MKREWQRQANKSQKAEIENAEKQINKPQLLKRLQAIKLRDKGLTNIEIAEFLLLDDQTISNWCRLYKKKGLEELLKWDCKGKVSVLTLEHQKKLRERNKEKPFETASEAKAYIEKQFGISFHLHWVQKILKKKLQRTFKKTRLSPGKVPSEEEQTNFVDWYDGILKAAKNNELHLLSYDPVHQLHNTINGRCWQRKGES